ncbi:tetratricopeptide repeat protein [Bradyrhizobium erythrophlei]|uniref:tetratricopeptide repeat protein n=1 Tax=Bradyrhizobium erythrophlei TaxID=1437360 RepID=UPI0035EA4CC6
MSAPRKLAAILAADVAGYSRLTGLDEEGTLERLRKLRRELIDPAVSLHRGRIVKTTGDGILIEFPSVVDAVRCALDVQRGMDARNWDVQADQRIEFRVGINVGDVVVEGEDLLGDGVNVAARLEGIAEPGGICISDAAYQQVRDKVDANFEDTGEQRLKNIERPVRTFRVLLGAPNVTARSRLVALKRKRVGVWIFGGVLALLAVGVGAVGWWQDGRRSGVAAPQPASIPKTVGPLSQRPTVAVLPFLTMSAGSADDYFADGLTEDIISALGRFSQLAVLARNAVFPYKGKQLRSEELGRSLGARYLVEGSVRRSPEHLRISVQLSDASNGTLLWSTQYDAEPKDIFSIQDNITRQVSGALAVKLTKLEQARSTAKPSNNLEAYDLVLRGRALMARNTRSANVEARGLFRRAIEVDPEYAAAYAGLGYAYHLSVMRGWTDQPVDTEKRVESLAGTAIRLDGSNTSAHVLLGAANLRFRNYDQAIDELKLALDLNPSDAETYAWLGVALLYTGALGESIRAIETALHFDPNLDTIHLTDLGMAYLLADRITDATRVAEQAIARDSGFAFAYSLLAAAYAEADRPEDAARAAAAARKLDPFFDTGRFGSLFRNPEHRAKLASALGKAGL